MVTPKAAANNDWFFQKVFGDGDFIAAGQLVIPPKGKKPSKGTKDNTYVSVVMLSFISDLRSST
jgi:centromere protein C